jgi:hypothetical protein
MTSFDGYKNEGNNYHSHAMNQTSIQEQANSFNSAIQMYQKAHLEAGTENQKSSICEKLGKTYRQLGKIYEKLHDEQHLDKVQTYYKDALLSFIEAFRHASSNKPEWKMEMQQTVDRCITEALDTDYLSPKCIVNVIESHLYISKDPMFRCWCQEKIVNILLNAGKMALGRQEIGVALGYLRECSSVIVEGAENNMDEQQTTQEHKAELNHLLCEAKSLQQLNIGNYKYNNNESYTFTCMYTSRTIYSYDRTMAVVTRNRVIIRLLQ